MDTTTKTMNLLRCDDESFAHCKNKPYTLDGKGRYLWVRLDEGGNTLSYGIMKFGTAESLAFGPKSRVNYGVVTYTSPSGDLIQFEKINKKEYDRLTEEAHEVKVLGKLRELTA